MAEKNNKPNDQIKKTIEKKKRTALEGYEELIDRLEEVQGELQKEIKREYREARGYVRTHPEEGVLIASIGGISLGYILGKLGRK